MQIKKILLMGYCCIQFFSAYSQTLPKSSISGTIKDQSGQAIEGASIKLGNRGVAQSNFNGRYRLSNVEQGTYTLIISALGFEKSEQTVKLEKRDLTLDVILIPKVQQMDEVAVIGRTENQEVNRQAYNVTAIDAKSLHNSTLDISHALDRVSGVRVRESGGVGSNFNFSLNGFTGNQVKFFIDGIPMDNFGTSFQINNIPINFAERVEVYKGVVPVWLGSDALGGAINIITGTNRRNYVDVSYAYGSFNTHRTAINTAFTSESGITLQLSAYQNYSDNNYWQTNDVSDINTGKFSRNQRIRRFHDNYHNEMVTANVGVVDKKYADKLLLGISLGQNYKEIQSGVRITQVFGAWHRKGNMVMPTLKYQKKNLFVEGLDLTINGNFNFGSEQNIDTAFRRYDWFGNYKQYEGKGSERSRTMYKYKNNNGLFTATASYKINDQHAFTLNNVFTSFDRKGHDELDPSSLIYQQPQRTNKNITGVGYKFDYNEQWSLSVFGKYYYQGVHYSRSYNPSGNWGDVAYMEQDGSTHRFGYGLATSYYLQEDLQLKASYEKSSRLPENEEIFGDMVTQASNLDLKPESSDNINLGLHYTFAIRDDHKFSVAANAIYRYATDFIYFAFNSNQTMTVAGNRDGVSNMGGDGEIRYSFKNLFTVGANVTYQNIRNKQKIEPGFSGLSPLYNDRMPNLPYLFGNADASVFLRNVGGKGNNLTFGYNLLYVHAFYLYWPSRGSDKLDIPTQFAHDANIVYSLKDGKYNIALEGKNLTDALLYDNFSLPKPSRSFYLKLRYFIGK